jgi:hypothetical protein
LTCKSLAKCYNLAPAHLQRTGYPFDVSLKKAHQASHSAFFFFIFVFQCIPTEYFWTRYTGGTGSCLDTSIVVAATYGYSAISCVGDLIFALLPVSLVWSLQMSGKEKIAVAAILALGAM